MANGPGAPAFLFIRDRLVFDYSDVCEQLCFRRGAAAIDYRADMYAGRLFLAGRADAGIFAKSGVFYTAAVGARLFGKAAGGALFRKFVLASVDSSRLCADLFPSGCLQVQSKPTEWTVCIMPSGLCFLVWLCGGLSSYRTSRSAGMSGAVVFLTAPYLLALGKYLWHFGVPRLC